MVHVLVIDLYNLNIYNDIIEINLKHHKITHETVRYDKFNTIDFNKYTHIILTGSDYYISNGQIVLSKGQIYTLLGTKKPILAQCYAFQLLAHYLCGSKTCVKLFRKKHNGFLKIDSPLVKPNSLYYVNHYNYVDYLNENWNIISKKTIRDIDGTRKTFIMDAYMKDFPVLCLQYHPESSIENYDFIKKWIDNSLSVYI